MICLGDMKVIDDPMIPVAQSVNINLITYDYAVDHNLFRINSKNSSDVIKIAFALLSPSLRIRHSVIQLKA